MKRREFFTLFSTLAGAALTIYLPAGWSPAKAAAKWKVGFSQCTTIEPWRVQFNKDMQAEAKKHPEIELDRHRWRGQDREAGRRRREPDRPGGRRAA